MHLSKRFISLVILIFMSGCNLTAKDLGVKTILAGPDNPSNIKKYSIENDDLVQVVIESSNDLRWTKAELHEDVLSIDGNGRYSWKFKTKNAISSEFENAWKSVSPKEPVDDLTFIKLKTPSSAFSFGAEIYVGVSSFRGNSIIRYSASTTLIVEKENLQSNLIKIKNLVDKKVNEKYYK